MKRLRRFWKRLAGTFLRTHGENDLAFEIQDHLERQTQDNIRSGMAPAEARRAAFVRFGGVESVKEEYREQRGLPFVETLLQDVRFALRSFRKRPVFAAVMVLSLAIGIGLNATIFTWLKAVYLNPLPGVTEARRLVTINASYPSGDGYSNSFADYAYLLGHSRLFSGLFAHEMLILALSGGGSTEMATGGIVSGNYFDVLGAKIAIGRGFRPEEDQVLDRDAVIVLGDGVWRNRFGADRAILGQRVELNRIPFTVIGVAAPRFIGVYGGLRQDFWIPMHMARALDPAHKDSLANGSWLEIMGRPKTGVSIPAIQAELDVLSPQMHSLYHKDDTSYRARVFPLHRAERGFHSGLFEMVRILGVVVVLLLLLACLNAANLQMGRASERSREISIRISLGAGRRRIIRQLLTESLLIAALAGVASLLIVFATRSIPATLAPPDFGLYLNLGIDWRVMIFLFAVSAITAFLFGLWPALETARVDVTDSLKEGSGNTTAGRRRTFFRRVFVVGQVALAITALFGAALFGEYLRRVMHADRGFDSKNILTAQTDLFAAGFNENRGRAFYRDSVQRLEAVPGIQSAAWTTFLPMSGWGGSNRRAAEIRGYTTPDHKPLSIVVDTVSAGYLKTLGIRMEKGREFSWSDAKNSAPVLMVNQQFVDQYLKGRDPIGAQVRIDATWRSIVGVHRNYVYRDPAQSGEPTILLPITQDYSTQAIVVVRTKMDPSQEISALRRVIKAFDSNLPIAQVMTMEENVGFHFVQQEAGTAALAAFAAIASLLAAIGIYAVLAAYVNQRRREFGIRIALGAVPRDIRSKIMIESARMALIGGGIGLVLSAGLGKLLESQMFTLNPFDPRLYAITALGMAAIAILSTLVPARSASRMEPMTALRSE